MCTSCGCGEKEKQAPNEPGTHSADLHFGLGLAGTSVAGMDQSRIVRIEQDILSLNNSHAERNRAWFESHGVLVLNLMSSPGSGKTTLLVRTMEALKDRLPLTVIEGDQQTSLDADRIRATGVAAVQVNTGKGCHLDGHMIGHALERLDVHDNSVLFIENVGNLICPTAFDLGETDKVVILSVTEGDDKALKYPDMFASAGLMVLNKIDLLPHLRFDVERCVELARRVNPDIAVLKVSAETGEGMDGWYDWISTRHQSLQAGR